MDIPILGELIKSSSEKAGKKIAVHLDKVLGLDQGGKGLGDEILFTNAISQLSVDESEQIRKFEAELSVKTKEEVKKLISLEVADGIRLLTCLRVFVAYLLRDTAKQMKEINKAGKDKTVEEAYLKFDYSATTSFIKCLLSVSTTDEKIKFLYNRSIFSTIEKEKKPSPAAEFFASAKEKATKVAGEAAEAVKKSAKKNADDINFGEKAKSFRARAEEYYNNSKK